MESIYLDNASTTKPKQEVIDAMMPYFTDYWFNPSSLYSEGVKVKNDIKNARKVVADFINAKANEIYFTSGGSESNSWAIQGFVNRAFEDGKLPVIITSTIEHKSIATLVERINVINTHFVRVNSEGFVDLEILESILQHYSEKPTKYKILVSIQMANNEIGTIQYIKEIARLTHLHGGILHTDAVQAFGQIPIDVKEFGVDMMSVSGHKLCAIKGIGFLYKRNGVPINPLIYGAQMDGMRGGTENVPYIIGMAKAVELAKKNVKDSSRISMCRDYFIKKLIQIGCTLNGSRTKRLPNNINVFLPYNIVGESFMYIMDMSNIKLGIGAACNNVSIMPSPVLSAIGKKEDAYKAIRISFSPDITFEEIDKVIKEMEKQFQLLKGE